MLLRKRLIIRHLTSAKEEHLRPQLAHPALEKDGGRPEGAGSRPHRPYLLGPAPSTLRPFPAGFCFTGAKAVQNALGAAAKSSVSPSTSDVYIQTAASGRFRAHIRCVQHPERPYSVSRSRITPGARGDVYNKNAVRGRFRVHIRCVQHTERPYIRRGNVPDYVPSRTPSL